MPNEALHEKDLFNELVKSAQEGGAILCGKKSPSRAWEGFDVGSSRDFGKEVKRIAQNKRLMKFLSEWRKTFKGKGKSLEEVEKELGFA